MTTSVVNVRTDAPAPSGWCSGEAEKTQMRSFDAMKVLYSFSQPFQVTKRPTIALAAGHWSDVIYGVSGG